MSMERPKVTKTNQKSSYVNERDALRTLKQELLDGKKDIESVRKLPQEKICELFRETTDGHPILFLAIGYKKSELADSLIELAKKLPLNEQRHILLTRGFVGMTLTTYVINDSGNDRLKDLFVDWEAKLNPQIRI